MTSLINRYLISFSILLASCNAKVLDSNGEKYIQNLDTQNKCWEIIVNRAKVSNFKTNENGNIISVNLRGCSGSLNIDSVNSNNKLIYSLADSVVKHAIDINSYTGLIIDCSSNSKDSFLKRFEFKIENGLLSFIEESDLRK